MNAFGEQKDKALHRRLKELLSDERRQAVSFCNLFSRDAFVSRDAGESMETYSRRLVYTTAEWYHRHLHGAIPIIMLTTESSRPFTPTNANDGVAVLSLHDYLKTYFSSDSALLDLYDSVHGAAVAVATAIESALAMWRTRSTCFFPSLVASFFPQQHAYTHLHSQHHICIHLFEYIHVKMYLCIYSTFSHSKARIVNTSSTYL